MDTGAQQSSTCTSAPSSTSPTSLALLSLSLSTSRASSYPQSQYALPFSLLLSFSLLPLHPPSLFPRPPLFSSLFSSNLIIKSTSEGHWTYDIWYGIELNPEIFGFDIPSFSPLYFIFHILDLILFLLL